MRPMATALPRIRRRRGCVYEISPSSEPGVTRAEFDANWAHGLVPCERWRWHAGPHRAHRVDTGEVFEQQPWSHGLFRHSIDDMQPRFWWRQLGWLCLRRAPRARR